MGDLYTLVDALVGKAGSVKRGLTETQGLELVLGVGERCTVTSAIQRLGSEHLSGSDTGEISIILLRGRKPL